MKFQGVIFTDALNMKALTRYSSVEEIALNALLAGNDFLLYGDHIAPNVDKILQHDVPIAFEYIKKAYRDGVLSKEDLDSHVLKILSVKEKMQLQRKKKIPIEADLLDDLNSNYAKALKRDLYRSAITLVDNPQHLLPIKASNFKQIALVQMKEDHSFLKCLEAYTKVSPFVAGQANLEEDLKKFPIVIFSFNAIKANKEDFGISKEILDLIARMHQHQISVIITVFGTPYCLSQFTQELPLVIGYEDVQDSHEAIADVIFGSLVPTGKLPVSASEKYPCGLSL